MARRPTARTHRTTDRATAPRRGPRPLALHLAGAGAAWSSLRGALPLIAAGRFPWPAPLAEAAAALQRDLAARSVSAGAPESFVEAIDRAGERRMLDFAAGVAAYRDHPYRRALADPPALWRDGTTRLLDYGVGKGGAPLLVIPSLVNRGYVLDLATRASLMRYLARRGHRPLLVEWGAPGDAERGFDLSDYIAGRLGGALTAAAQVAGGPLPLVGYCMGGNLALALAQLRPDEVSGLALLATPWDFHSDGPLKTPLDEMSALALSAAFQAMPDMPVDLLQAMFASLDPSLVARKYRAFAKAQAAGEAGDLFVAVEDWVNDGVPLASKVAAECLVGWYGQNAPARGLWRVAGETIAPARCDKPALLLMPQRDRIVPPSSSRALAEALPRAEAVPVASGHVAMIVGTGAERMTWAPLAAWLDGLRPTAKPRGAATKTRATKKAPIKQASVKKTPAKKTPAKKTPAKKTPAKKAPAKKHSGQGPMRSAATRAKKKAPPKRR